MSEQAKHPPINYAPFIIIATFITIFVNGAVIAWAFWLNDQRPQVTLSRPAVEGTLAICPGETLNYQFTLAVTKPSTVDLQTSIQRVAPLDSVYYSRLQQFEFKEATSISIERHFVLPPTYQSPDRGNNVEWLPGYYTQRTTASIVGSRDQPVKIEVPFKIRSNCKPLQSKGPTFYVPIHLSAHPFWSRVPHRSYDVRACGQQGDA